MWDELSPGGRTTRLATIALAAAAASCLMVINDVTLLARLAPQAGGAGEITSPDRAGDAMLSVPLAFEPNAGRLDSRVDYVAHSPGASTYLTRHGATLQLSSGERSHAIELALAGSVGGSPVAAEKLPGTVNSLIGDQPSRWRQGLPTYGAVRYQGAWPGIDVIYRGTGSELQYDFELAAGADPRSIGIRVRGADGVRLAGNGDLLIEAGGETVRQRAPVAYQEIGGQRRPVASAYGLEGNLVRIDLGAYDRTAPLVIDPLVYSTVLGGSADDVITDVALGADGSIYVTGETASTDFPQTLVLGGAAGADAFVTKLSPTGAAPVVYSTLIGGSNEPPAPTCLGPSGVGADAARSIAVDADGSAYITGETRTDDFPTFGNGALGVNSPLCDGFVTKLSPTGQGGPAGSYSRYLGGSGEDAGIAIAIENGRALVTGSTSSADFPTSGAGALDQAVDGQDAFLTVLNQDPSILQPIDYSTYLGGAGVETGKSVAVAGGHAVVGGVTDSTGTQFPTTPSAFDPTNVAGAEGFISRIDPNPDQLGNDNVYSSYAGGTGTDSVEGVAVGPAGTVYLAGSTTSADFHSDVMPIGNVFQSVHGGGGNSDAYLLTVDTAGSGLESVKYHTYLGGLSNEFGEDVDTDESGNAYLSGRASGGVDGGTLPTTEGAYDRTLGTSDQGDNLADAFLSKLSPVAAGPAGGDLLYSSYLGGDGSEGGTGVNPGPAVAVGADGIATIAGEVSDDHAALFPYPTTSGALDPTYNGGDDGFVARLNTILAASPPPSGLETEPVFGKSVAARVISGQVFYRPPGSSIFKQLIGGEAIPLGSELDTRSGRVEITGALPDGSSDTPAQFFDGLFLVNQVTTPLRGPVLGGRLAGKALVKSWVEIKLKGALNCGRKARRQRREDLLGYSAGAKAHAAARARRVWGSGSGRYRTRGRGGTASVVGTTWLTKDTCKGTKFKVTEGKGVRVKDFGKRKGILLEPGESYLTK